MYWEQANPGRKGKFYSIKCEMGIGFTSIFIREKVSTVNIACLTGGQSQ